VNAVFALGELGDKRAVEPLIKALKDPDWIVRCDVAIALGALGDECAVEPLIYALKDPSEFVRKDAAVALRKLGDERAVEPLIKALKDFDKEMQWRAAEALGKIGDPKALDALERLKDDDSKVTYFNKVTSISEAVHEAIDKIKAGDAYKVYLHEQEEKKKRQIELERERKQHYVVNTIDELLRKEAHFFVDDIKNSLSKGDFEGAEKLLEERKRGYERYLDIVRSLKDVDDKTTKLSSRLAEGEVTSDAYEQAMDELKRKKYDIEEELGKIKRKIFREKYVKPF